MIAPKRKPAADDARQHARAAELDGSHDQIHWTREMVSHRQLRVLRRDDPNCGSAFFEKRSVFQLSQGNGFKVPLCQHIDTYAPSLMCRRPELEKP